MINTNISKINQSRKGKKGRDDKDVMLFWKTHMLYYVKTERLYKNIEIEDDGIWYLFDENSMQHKKTMNEGISFLNFRRLNSGTIKDNLIM